MEFLANLFSVIAVILFIISFVTVPFAFERESEILFQVIRKTFIWSGICFVLAAIFGILSCLFKGS